MPSVVAPEIQTPAEGKEWSTGFSGPFRILTYLDAGDKEIDTDDRGAVLIVRIEMLATGDLGLIAEDVSATLDFDFSEQQDGNGRVTRERANILFHGKEKGPLVLVGAPGETPLTISPEKPLERKVTISTGLFSVDGVPKQSLPAIPGPKWVNVTLNYKLQPQRHVGPQRAKAKATMQFCVAED